MEACARHSLSTREAGRRLIRVEPPYSTRRDALWRRLPAKLSREFKRVLIELNLEDRLRDRENTSTYGATENFQPIGPIYLENLFLEGLNTFCDSFQHILLTVIV